MNKKIKKVSFKGSNTHQLMLDDLMEKLKNPEHEYSEKVSFFYRNKSKRQKRK